ncbi:hypothetical protein JTB14_019302 [Gonioctena quinquepunctata]|nr:hypothetical protein JTB14_019302 [Gonioctena quinquepunctata]
MYSSDNHQRWDEKIDEIACAIRTSKHETDKLTPYFLNFGRNMVFSGADYSQYEKPVEDGLQTGDRSRNECFREMFMDVRKRLEKAGEKSCARYNLRCGHVEYLPNQLVWMPLNYLLPNWLLDMWIHSMLIGGYLRGHMS